MIDFSKPFRHEHDVSTGFTTIVNLDARELADLATRKAAAAADHAKASLIAAELGALGDIEPATSAQLKAMSLEQFQAWYAKNTTTTESKDALLRKLTLAAVQRLP